MAPRRIRCSVITGCLLAAVFLASVPGFAASGRLIACADPNNLPFSNRAGQGFENRLAELIAHDLHAKLGYVWWALRRGYVRNTLNTHRCDFWPGVARGIEMLATTQPYYRSDYVFVTRRSEHLTNLTLDDPRLASLKIAVQMVGNDAMNPPPAHALARRHLIDNIRGYMLYGNYTQPNPPPPQSLMRSHAAIQTWRSCGGHWPATSVSGPRSRCGSSRPRPMRTAHNGR